MARAHEVAIGADGRAFAQAVKKDIIKPVDEAAKALDDLGDEGETGGRKLEDALRDAERATERLSRAGKDVGDDLDRGFKRAKEGADDFKQEANSTAREAAASFDGSAESIGDAFQEVAANAFGGFGPAGAAAGLAAAAGLGLLTAEWQKHAEAVEKRTADMYQKMIDEQTVFVTDSIVANTVLEQSDEDIALARQVAAKAGLDAETARRAIAGDNVAMEEVIVGLEDRKRQAREDQLDAAKDGSKAVADGYAQEQRDIDATIGKLQGYTDAYGSASQKAGEAQSAVRNIGLTAEEAARKTQAAAQGAGDGFKGWTSQAHAANDAIKSIPTNINTRLNVDTSGVTVAENRLNELRRKAEQGITVNMKNVNGRQLLG